MKTLSRLCLSALCCTLALTGCRSEKPATVVDAAPTIEVFTASAATARPGERVTLSWKTRDASTVELREAARGAIDVPQDQVTGSFEVTVDAESLFVLHAKGRGGTDVRVVSVGLEGAAPTLRFSAVPAQIEGGASTTLVWNAPGASSVSLVADGVDPVDLLGQHETGALVVSPRRSNTSYTLTADGLTASVNVSVGLSILAFDALPVAVKPGDPITLRWETAGAGNVTLGSPGRNVLHTSTAASGTFEDVVPQLPQGGRLHYELLATQGLTTIVRTLDLVVGAGGRIVRFDAPAVAAAGAATLVRWETQGASSISIEVDGLASHRVSPAQLGGGAWSFTAPATDFQVELVMTDDSGATTRARRQVDVVGVPTSATLTATPAQVASGGTVTLDYVASDTRRLSVVDGDGQVVFSISGDGAERGSFTLNANRTTTYALTADNLLGDAVTAATTVTVTGTPVSVNVFPPTAVNGQVVDFTPSSPATLYGFSHDQVLVGTGADFHDISDTGTTVLTQGSSVVRVNLPFGTRLWGRHETGNLVISRCGWLAWGAPLAEVCTPTALPSSSAPTDFVAPFWANLSLKSTSTVQYEVVGEAPEQRLIVQWNDVATTASGSSLTFQAQLHQAGMISFHYLSLGGAQPGAIIGVQDHGRVSSLSTGQLPAADSARYYFSPVTSAKLRVTRGATWGGFVKLGASFSLVSGVARVVSLETPADLSMSEVMLTPAVADGQYVELFNGSEVPVELTGWSLTSSTAGEWVFPAGMTVPARGTLVLGASTDRALNDDAGVDVAWPAAFSLPLDGGTLRLGNPDAGFSQAWARSADGGVGKSTELDPGPLFLLNNNVQVSVQCESTAAFGAVSRGSPGASRGCFAYERRAIPARFNDISTTGTQLITSAGPGVPTADVQTLVTLAPGGTDPAPFVFGVRAPQLFISTNGWLTRGSVTVTVNQSRNNKGWPSSTAPVGAIAPFWDSLVFIGGTSSVAWQKLEPGADPSTPERHWIVQWSNMRHLNAASTTESLSFQAKLFEDGRIEFHYGTMFSGTTQLFGMGSSATVWLENPAGNQALVVSPNTIVPREGTAWRFTAR